MSESNSYYDAFAKCADRYKGLVESYIDDGLYWGFGRGAGFQDARELRMFIDMFKAQCASSAPLTKMNRWLGYIQGTMIAWGITTVEAERDWTRPLFRPLDFPNET